MNGLESLLLRGRLSRAGLVPSIFRYPSTRASIEMAADSLASTLHEFGEEPVHLVGHSLGGLVILEAFDRHEGLPDGRIVLLGSPVRGSVAARAVAAWPIGPRILGRLAADSLLSPRARTWKSRQSLGVIAGTLSAGFGRLVSDLPVPNDGTVAVDETRLDGMSDHLVLPVTHTGMLLSSDVANHVARFLDLGNFR